MERSAVSDPDCEGMERIEMISVIIPAFNAEKTIQRAVQSVIEQLSGRCEVIIVENGCTDRTAERIRDCYSDDPAVILMHSDAGVSRARNAGMERASGEWVMFLDADDYLESNAGKVIEESLRNPDFDLLLFGHIAGNRKRPVWTGEGDRTANGSEIRRETVRMLENPTRYMQIWAKLFRRSLILDCGIRFNEKLTLSEDGDFMLRYLLHCTGIRYSKELIYHYSYMEGSALHRNTDEMVNQFASAMKETARHMEGRGDDLRHAYSQYVLMHLNIAMVRSVFMPGSDLRYREKRRLLQKAARMDVFARALQDCSIRDCLKIRMLPMLFLKMHSPDLAAAVYAVRSSQNAASEKRTI